MGLNVRIIDKGYKYFVSEIKKLDENPRVNIGVLEENASRSDGLDNVDIMVRNEFGIDVPQRSVIKAGTDNNIKKAFKVEVQEYDKIIKGKGTIEEMVNKIGAFQKMKFRERFSTKYLQPNSPFTIMRKGSNIPLVDSGELRKSIDFKKE